jgi:2-polyprenyl-6-methoxyphenol hydroxylase-like FAD-dependent oxidoreductase
VNPQVIVVGGGPVGLTLALDLGKRGIRCTLIEQKPEPQFLPKMERCNARTMEMFRRIGIAEKIRSRGLISSVAMDVFVILSMTERPLLRLPYPSVDQMREDIRTTNDGSMPLEPYQLISQYTLEPLLKEEAECLAQVQLRYGCEFLEFNEDNSGVTVTFRNAASNIETARGAYLVGCDGGGSLVRKQLGIKLKGEGHLLKLRQSLYRCDELYDRIPLLNGPGHGRHYHVADNQSTFLIMQDSRRHWTLHAAVETDEEMKLRFEQTIGAPVTYEMLYCGEWHQNLLLADSYSKNRVFLAGDAVHLVIPTGGLGMNTGVGDAIDLSWKLAAMLEGWGGPDLLRSYEIERRQIGERNVGASRYASLGRRKWRSQWRPEIRAATAAGQAARDHLARVADVEQRKTNEMIGAELGYRYVDSPIIDDVPGGPEHVFRDYNPTTWPGARLPHVWLDDGTPFHDRIPTTGFTLLRLNKNLDVSGIEKAFRARRATFRVLDVPDQIARAVYDRDLLLLRPDLHIVWRGNRPPTDVARLSGIATGHETGESEKRDLSA